MSSRTCSKGALAWIREVKACQVTFNLKTSQTHTRNISGLMRDLFWRKAFDRGCSKFSTRVSHALMSFAKRSIYCLSMFLLFVILLPSSFRRHRFETAVQQVERHLGDGDMAQVGLKPSIVSVWYEHLLAEVFNNMSRSRKLYRSASGNAQCTNSMMTVLVYCGNWNVRSSFWWDHSCIYARICVVSSLKMLLS